jgi:aryl-alcohol dehydrogenase-like predicted oxidoreductase
MLWQAPEAEVFPLCSANGISQIVWSPLAQGVLTGKYKPGQPLPADSRFASDAMNFAQGLVYNDETLAAVQRLIPVAEGAGLSLPTLALTWVLRRGEVASRRRGPELTADVLAAIDAALGAAPVRAPTLALLAQEGVLHR